MASIMKNFQEYEQHIFQFSLSFENMENIANVGKYLPPELSIVDGLVEYMHNIHLDYDLSPDEEEEIPTLYDIPSCNLIELRGTQHERKMTNREMHYLLMERKHDVQSDSQDSFLNWLYDLYDDHMDEHPRSLYKYDIFDFFHYCFHDKQEVIWEHQLQGRIVTDILNKGASQEEVQRFMDDELFFNRLLNQDDISFT
jgi:hypothetical protein